MLRRIKNIIGSPDEVEKQVNEAFSKHQDVKIIFCDFKETDGGLVQVVTISLI